MQPHVVKVRVSYSEGVLQNKGHIMAQSLSRVIIHIIFSTKNRQKFLIDEIRGRLHAYLATVLRDKGSVVFKVGGTSDHVHIACSLTRTFSQSDLIKKLKVSSTKWMKENFDESFSWQTGYGVFSIGESQLSALVSYIENQVEHHRMKSFKDEFRTFLNKYNINFDEQYVWE